MTLDEMLGLIRAGVFDLAVSYDGQEEAARLQITWGEGLLEAIRRNQQELVWLLQRNDVTMCSDLAGHAPYHVAGIWTGGGYMRCEECARRRARPAPGVIDMRRSPRL